MLSPLIVSWYCINIYNGLFICVMGILNEELDRIKKVMGILKEEEQGPDLNVNLDRIILTLKFLKLYNPRL